MRASRESWGRSPECLEEGAGRRTPEKACGVDVLMWCSAFYDFADVRAVAVNRDRQQTALTREWRENEPPRITDPHPAPSSARPRCTELRRSEQGQHSARGQHRGSSGVIAFTIRRAVCRCHLLSPRAAPTRRSDDQSTACPALPMPSRAAGRSPRREEPVEEVLIRLFAPWPRWRASAAF